MSIVKIDGDAVTHRCGACGFEREVAFDLIEIGVIPDADGYLDLDGTDRADPLVAFPSCNKCGSVEVLCPSSEDHEPFAREGDFAELWERLAGVPLDGTPDQHELPGIDITTDDYQSLF